MRIFLLFLQAYVSKNNSTQGMNVYAQGVHLGAAGNASIGDLEIQGLNVGTSTITISGH